MATQNKKPVLQQLVEAGLSHDQIVGLGKYKAWGDKSAYKDQLSSPQAQSAYLASAAARRRARPDVRKVPEDNKRGDSGYKRTGHGANSLSPGDVGKSLGDAFSKHNPSSLPNAAANAAGAVGNFVRHAFSGPSNGGKKPALGLDAQRRADAARRRRQKMSGPDPAQKKNLYAGRDTKFR